MSARRGPAVSRALKALVVLAAALAGAEAAARWLFPQEALVYRDSLNPRLRFELRPGSRGVKAGVPVFINEDGLRDASLSSPKPDDERRVVVVGGQETFGVGVEEERIFTRLAGEGWTEPGRVRAVNLSMYSYNLAQKVELACERLSRLKPEIAVLQAADSDAGALPPPALDAPRLKNWVREHSALARRAAEGIYLGKTAGSGVPEPARLGSPPEPKDAAGDAAVETEAERQLRRFQECAAAAGASGAVMMISSPSGRGLPSALARDLEAAARRLRMPFRDAGPAVRRLPAERRMLGESTPFLSPASHRAVSEELKKLLKPLLRKKPLPRPSA